MNSFYMERTAVTITLVCNLRCGLCSNYMPYYKQPNHFSVERLKNSFEQYFSIVTHVKKLTISGGEPFLHPDLPKIIDICTDFGDKFDILEVITNGTILPSDELLSSSLKIKDILHYIIPYAHGTVIKLMIYIMPQRNCPPSSKLAA